MYVCVCVQPDTVLCAPHARRSRLLSSTARIVASARCALQVTDRVRMLPWKMLRTQFRSQNCKNVHELGRFAGNNRSCERSLDRARSRGSTKGAVNIRTTHSAFVPPCIDRKEQNQQCQRHDGDVSNAERTPSAMPVATVPPICVDFDEQSPPARRGDEPSSGLSTVHAAATAAQQVDPPIPNPSDASMQLKFPKAVMHMIREASLQSDGSFLADLSRSLFGAEPFEFSVWMQETLLDWMMQIPLGLLTSHLSPASFSKLSALFKKSARNWCSVLDDIELPVSVFETRANQMKIKSVRPAVCVLTNCSRLRVALEGQGDLSGSEVHLYTSTSAGGDNTTSLPLSQLQPRPSVDVDTTQLNLPRLGSAIVQAVCPPRALYSQRETLVLTRDQMVQTELSDAVLVLRALEEHEKVQLCAFMYLIGCALASQVPETTCEKLREVMEWLGWSHTASKLQAICDQDTGHAAPSNIIWQQHSDAPAPPSEPKLASDAPHIQPACIPIEEGNEQRLVDESAIDAAPLGHPVMCNSFS